MIDNRKLDIARIRDSLKPLDAPAGLAAHDRPRHSDFDLNGRTALLEETTAATLREAAVLVPLVARSDGYRVLLTQRTDHLNHHAGQVCFPGGRLDADDEDHLAAALRETCEEVGLEAGFVEPLGRLDDYETGTNFLVTPIVARVRPGFVLKLEAFEVAEAFEVPLHFLFDERNHQVQSRMRNGERRHYYVFEYEQHYIWGATAGMLMNFYRRVFKVPAPTQSAAALIAGSRANASRDTP